MCKSFDYNIHSITIGATRTGKSIFLKYLQENLPINRGFTVNQFTKITFDEVLKNYLETMQKTIGER